MRVSLLQASRAAPPSQSQTAIRQKQQSGLWSRDAGWKHNRAVAAGSIPGAEWLGFSSRSRPLPTRRDAGLCVSQERREGCWMSEKAGIAWKCGYNYLFIDVSVTAMLAFSGLRLPGKRPAR